MKIIQFSTCVLTCSLLTLVACSSTSTVKQSATPIESNSSPDPLKYGNSSQPISFDNEVKTKVTNAKTIAVTDISYSQEFSDAFYFEENKIKRSDSTTESNSQISPNRPVVPIAPKDNSSSEKPTSNILPKRQFDDKSVFMRNVGFIKVQSNLDDLPLPPLPPAPQIRQNKEPKENDSIIGSQESITGNNFEHSYTKKYGIEKKISYGEIRGLSGSIKAMLLRAGYKIIQAKPNVARIDQNDDFFDIVKRIEAGYFSGADFVLYGVLTGLSQSANNSPIPGTTNSMSVNELTLAIDFSLIDTKSLRVVASFVASGSATDNRIDGEAESYKPNTTKMLRNLSDDLAQNVAYHLASQDFVSPDANQYQSNSRAISGTEKYRYEERNFKVYK